MLTVAYLANLFPASVEPYVGDEIEELCKRGVRVVVGSIRRSDESIAATIKPEIVLQGANWRILLAASRLCVWKWRRIVPLIVHVLFRGSEGLFPRLKALVHTFLGACYAVLLRQRGVDHIHVHHGYFGSWVAMTAARLLGVGFSMSLHGSDLLQHSVFLDVKLESCKFCLTVSEYNRRYILERYPHLGSEKVLVSRLGVNVPEDVPAKRGSDREIFTMLAVGRLHKVKDHAFLVRACAQLAARGVQFECMIAGDGPEQNRLRALIYRERLDRHVTLLGHVPREQMDSLYDRADVVVLTSRSEGIPLVLMEAMARGKVVLAPAITGIPELVVAGQTGFLYQPGSQDEFVDRLIFIRALMRANFEAGEQNPHLLSAARQLDWVRHAGRAHVRQCFNRRRSLRLFGDMFLLRVAAQNESIPDENLVLQQI